MIGQSSAQVVALDILARTKGGAMVSYAQNYEDVMLKRVFQTQRQGFFVDVGAFHPIRNSVTQHFHLKGWRGINLDPDPDNMSLFNNLRPSDINICVAVGRSDGETDLYSLPNTSRTTALKELADSYLERGLDVHKKSVATRSLASVFSELEIGAIDFLKIDVEGAELDVIAGNDWDRHRPKIVLAEATYPETSTPSWEEWDSRLLHAEYSFAYFDGLNRYYVRDEDEALLTHFQTPPNYFDDFVRADTVELAEAVIAQE